MSRDRLLKLVAIGTAAGAFSGLFGVGGGTVIVPLLILWLGYGEREATGTSLAAIVVIAALATAGQGLYGNVDVANAVVVGAPALIGVVAGAALQQRLPERAVALLFAALLVATAVALIAGLMEYVAAALLGFAGGTLGGLVGVGGGVLFVPALAIFLDQSQIRAEATSLLAIVFVALVGAWRQQGYGNVRVRDGLLVGALSPLGVAAGVVISNAVPERTLELLFAALALVFAAQLLRRALATPPHQAPN